MKGKGIWQKGKRNSERQRQGPTCVQRGHQGLWEQESDPWIGHCSSDITSYDRQSESWNERDEIPMMVLERRETKTNMNHE